MSSVKIKSVVLLAALVGLSATAGGCGGGVTQANYDKVQNGMTQEQVEAILGTGKEQASNTVAIPGIGLSSKTLTWGDDQKKITVVFANGKVVSKLPTGLS